MYNCGSSCSLNTYKMTDLYLVYRNLENEVTMKNKKVAHFREYDQKVQSVEEHLLNVSEICGKFTDKIGLRDAGILLGILHDIGKYSDDFQAYIKSATGLLNDEIDDDYVDSESLKGKIDHSTAGAQWIWEKFEQYSGVGKVTGQVLAVCLASHHGGLIDCLNSAGKDNFLQRMKKEKRKTHFTECFSKRVTDKNILDKINNIDSRNILENFQTYFFQLISDCNELEIIRDFKLGFFTRFLFSCLIDADRIDSADFEYPGNKAFRSISPPNWEIAIKRLETGIADFTDCNEINCLRRDISLRCKERAKDDQGIYTLTVPTGGGKTFASMRYALHHAEKHNLDHIIYVIPFTSIIEQNAEAVRKILEAEDDRGSWILEHHSNLEPEDRIESSRIFAENWNAPIILTTMVEFLETLFGAGTRGARRLHNTANSVIIFDEIQSLPVNIVHPFCNALQFLVDHTRTTAILCTATQPLLDKLQNPEFGQLKIPEGNEIIENVDNLFNKLERVEIKNCIRPQCWSESEIARLAVEQLRKQGNCLVIVNTKKWAQNLYRRCLQEVEGESIFHLSTNLCPSHREIIFENLRERLDNKLPVLCITTQLIEAGVDIDFNSVIRFLAGLDSIAQAAGRCNRNSRLATAPVYIVNPGEESIDMLPDIKAVQEVSRRIFEEYEDCKILNPETMLTYFRYYFYDRKDTMSYNLNEEQAGRKDTLLSLLSNNSRNIGREEHCIKLQQSFRTAGKAFKSINAPTRSVIVPYGTEGKEIIALFCASFKPDKDYKLLQRSQRYSVNVFPNIWEKLNRAGAVKEVQEGEEIYYLFEEYYDNDFGLSAERISPMETNII